MYNFIKTSRQILREQLADVWVSKLCTDLRMLRMKEG